MLDPQCLLCERTISGAEAVSAYHVPRFPGMVLCPTCLNGERFGYGVNAERVAVELRQLQGRRLQQGRPHAN